jgi:hypothetical protein
MKYRGVRDDGSQAGVNEEVWSGIGVAPPKLDTSGIGACGEGRKGWRADFIYAFKG